MPLRDTINKPMHTRPCAVAGKFYPSDPVALRRDLETYLGASWRQWADTGAAAARPIRAIIAPHAGYIYSAPVAASAYRSVLTMKGVVRRVVLIGPSHYVPFTGLACSSAGAFETPFGDVPVDTGAVKQLTESKRAVLNDEAHAPEHGLEVHLPFLVHVLDNSVEGAGAGFTIVPMLFGDVGYGHTADALMPFFEDPATLVVVSSDLSHYQDYETATGLDRQTADAIVGGRIDAVTSDRACGHTAIRAVLRCAESLGLDVTELDLRNSGDTAGPRDHVVGYGAFMIR